MRKIYCRLAALATAVYLLAPSLALAAGGKASMLVVVADPRPVAASPWTVFFLNLYNTDPFMFGLWCTILTGGLGVSLGLLTDFLMKRTGIDLTSRKIVEH